MDEKLRQKHILQLRQFQMFHLVHDCLLKLVQLEMFGVSLKKWTMRIDKMLHHALCIPSGRILSKVFLLWELRFLFVPITAQCKWNCSQTQTRRASGDIVLLSRPLRRTPFCALCTTYTWRQRRRYRHTKYSTLSSILSTPRHSYFITAGVKSQRNKECLAWQLG